MTKHGWFIEDRNGRTVAFECASDVVMRRSLDNDTDLKRAVSILTGKPIREAQQDHKRGVSRVIRCFKCNGHFSPAQKIETRFGIPYYDAGWRPFHAKCIAEVA